MFIHAIAYAFTYYTSILRAVVVLIDIWKDIYVYTSYVVVFVIYNDLRWQVVVGFVDIGGIVDITI